VLRPFTAADVPALHRLVNDWDVAKNLARVPFPYPLEAGEEWINATRAQFAAEEACHLAVVLPDDVLIGAVGLTFAREGGRAELGYWVGRRYWGDGYAAEAAAALCRWGFTRPGLQRIWASTLLDNHRSQAVLRRLGFVAAGEGTQPFLARGGPMPVALFEAGPEAFASPAPAVGRPVLLVAAVALVDADGRVLLAERPAGKSLAGLWEFPGGKVEPGETPEACLIRELKEELDIDVESACLGPFTFASHAYEKFHLLMPLYLCRRWQGMVRPREGQRLAWVAPMRLGEYPMPPADKPLVAMLQDLL